MTIRYVDSVGGDDTTGLSWATAYATVQQAITDWASGDIIYVDQDHAETSGTTITWTASAAGTKTDPVVIIRVNKATDVYAPTTGADTINVQSTNVNTFAPAFTTNADGFYIAGLRCKAPQRSPSSINNIGLTLIDCYFETTETDGELYFYSGNANNEIRAINCTFSNLAASASAQVLYLACYGEFTNCTFMGKVFSDGYIRPVPSGVDSNVYVKFNGCDFSDTNITKLLDLDGNAVINYYLQFNHCLIHNTSWVYEASGRIAAEGHGGQRVDINNCDYVSGGGNYKMVSYQLAGEYIDDTAVYVTAGFTHADGNTHLSYKLTPASICKNTIPLEAPPIVSYISSTGSKTFTLEALLDSWASPPTDAEFWIDIYYLGTASSAKWDLSTTQSALISGNQVIPGSGAALAAGAGIASWTGEAGTDDSVKLTKTLTINKIGHYMIIAKLGKYESAKSAWIDGKVTVS